MRIVRAAVLVALVLPAGSALAGRALVEPKAWRSAAGTLPKAAVDEAARTAGLTDCGPAVLQSADVQGLGCRAAAAAATLAKKPIAKPSDVDAQAAFAAELDAAARSVAELEPLVEPRPGFERRRFEAHRATCRALLGVHDRLSAIAAGDPKTKARAEAALASFGPGRRPLKDAACGCVQASVGLARGADASLEETGALQSVLTSRGCFLDETKLKADRRPGGGVPAEAADVAASRSDEARIVEYARARDVGLERCREKALDAGRLKDPAKLEKCVCGEIGRWKFPARAGGTTITVKLPVVEEQLAVAVDVDAAGAPAKCGPLSGAMLPAAGGS